jgi:hypothetical protein
MALSDLAFARRFEAVFGRRDDPAESHTRLWEATRKAVTADENDAMAQIALAIFGLFSGGHEDARRRLHRALDLDPNSMFARGFFPSCPIPVIPSTMARDISSIWQARWHAQSRLFRKTETASVNVP